MKRLSPETSRITPKISLSPSEDIVFLSLYYPNGLQTSAPAHRDLLNQAVSEVFALQDIGPGFMELGDDTGTYLTFVCRGSLFEKIYPQLNEQIIRTNLNLRLNGQPEIPCFRIPSHLNET